MFKDSKLIIPSIIIGLSFISASLINGYFESNPKPENSEIMQTQEESALLSKEEAAKYLKISTTELDDIINKDIDRKQNMAIFDTYQFIPYANLNGKLIFTKTNLIKWIDYNTGKKE